MTITERLAGLPSAHREEVGTRLRKAARTVAAEPIAIIGAGCRLPGGADSPDGLWRLLEEGRDAVGEGPDGRWDVAAFYDRDPGRPGRSATRWGAFLDDVAGFDAAAFGIAPAEAAAMDPQQRLMLEVGWESLEHAGIVPSTLSGTPTGVFAGLCHNDYLVRLGGHWNTIDGYTGTGNAHSVAAGRLSYLLGLNGPSIAVDTACSSSLVAVHLACQSLRMRECELALAGGASLILSPESMLALSSWGVFSPTGRCRSFDAAADGIVRGEGAAIVVLKRLTDALRDDDRVLGVIRGSAVNSDGRSQGLTAPHPGAQRAVIRAALDQAAVDPAEVALIETHGTGTPLGDPIEFAAIAAVYGGGERPCALGALKTNIGHTEATAGVAGLLKAVLSLQNGTIPANLYFSAWNPKITPTGTRLYIPTKGTRWPNGPRYAAVSSFGISGTNAHLILEAAPTPTPKSARGSNSTLPSDASSGSDSDSGSDSGSGAGAGSGSGSGAGSARRRCGASSVPWTIPLSAGSAPALRSEAERLARWLREHPGTDLADVAHTLGVRREHRSVRTVIEAVTPAELLSSLDHIAGELGRPATKQSVDDSFRVISSTEQPVNNAVWVFSGQGSQWPGMGRDLLRGDPAFARTIAALDPMIAAEAGFSVTEILAAGLEISGTEQIQPVLFAVQVALAAAWRARGLEPAAVVGQSMGEVAAAVVAGALPPGDGVKVICRRSRLLLRIAGRGAMASVDLPHDRIDLTEAPGTSVAVISSPGTTVVAGDPDEIASLIAGWRARGLLARRVAADIASHSPQVDPLLTELAAQLADLSPRPATVPFYTTVGGDPRRTVTFDAAHWTANLREPVHLTAAIEAAAADGHRTYLEISPHPVLTYAITENTTVLHTLRRDEPARLHTQLGRLYRAGVTIDWSRAHGTGRLLDLPTRAWDHHNHWIPLPRPRPGADEQAGDHDHPLLGRGFDVPGPDGLRVWRGDLGTARVAWLADHVLNDGAVLPGTGFCEIALAAAVEFFGVPTAEVEVRDVRFECFLALAEHTGVSTVVTPTADGEGKLEIFTRPGGEWLRHASATLRRVPPVTPAHADIAELTARHSQPVDVPSYYARLRASGYHYGPAFTGLRALRVSQDTVLARVAVPAHATTARPLHLHPVLLDVCLQAVGAAHAAGPGVDATATPHSVGRLRIHGDTTRTRLCEGTVTFSDGGTLTSTVRLLAEDGTCLAEIEDARFHSVETSHRRLDPLFHHIDLEPTELTRTDEPRPESSASQRAKTRPWAVLGTGVVADGIAERLAAVRTVPDGFAGGIVVVADPVPEPGAARAAVEALLERVRPSLTATGRLFLVASSFPEPIRALARVLAFEHEDLRPTILTGTDIELIVTEVLADDPADEVTWINGVRHVARLVNRPMPPVTPRIPLTRPDGAYVITGGLGGIGLAAARWLAGAGARHLVLNGRTDRTPQAVTDLRNEGIRDDVITGEIAEPGVAEQLVAGLEVRGILHAAAVVDDAVLSTLTPAQLARTWRPKADGAARLHEATLGRDLDWFVLFSSGSAMYGSLGLGAYTAANAWLDGFARFRRAANLPALSVCWGPWGEVGLAVGLGEQGYATLPTRDALDALRLLIEAGTAAPPSIGVFPADPEHWLAPAPSLAASPFFARVASTSPETVPDQPGRLVATLTKLDTAARRKALQQHVSKMIETILDLPGPVPPSASLVALGFDSLSAMRLRRHLQSALDVNVPATLVWTHPTLDLLTDHLLTRADLEGPRCSPRPRS